MVLATDSAVDDEALETLRAAPGILGVHRVTGL